MARTDRGPAHKDWRGPDVSYSGVHERIRRWKGFARAHVCVCGAPADEWAYLSGDPTEKTEVTPAGATVRFGTDPEFFAARCRSCHRKADAPSLRTHCAAGHEFTPDNTSRTSQGARRCLACHREWMRAYNARKRAAV